MSIRALLLFLLLFSPCTAVAQTSAATSRVVIDEFETAKFVTATKEALNIPTLAVGIVGPDSRYFLETYGPSEPGQPYLIGSLSKSVTAMAVGLLVHEGKLSYADPASNWFESAPAEVTVGDLVHQTSGLSRSAGANGWSDLDTSLDEAVANATWSRRGTYQYSNLNYQMLGGIVEKSSGMAFGTFVRERIFAPAGMTSASAGPRPPDQHVVGNQYLFVIPSPRGEPEYRPIAVPSGFVWMSAVDMERWLRLFLGRGQLDGKRVVPAAVVDDLLKASPDSTYRGGWSSTDRFAGTEVLIHDGATAAFTSAMAIVPDRKFGVFVLTNVNSFAAFAPMGLLRGLVAPILGTQRESVSNLEIIARGVGGLIVAITFFAFLFELLRWMRSRFPIRLTKKEMVGVILTATINGAVYLVVTMELGTTLGTLWAVQPDIALGFVVLLLFGTLRRLFTGFVRSQGQLALAREE